MDLVARIKEKLSKFRVKELKEVLTLLKLSKQGRKQDLADRILAILSEDEGLPAKKNTVRKDEVAKLVDDTYRKMQGSGAADLSSKSQAISESANIKLKEEIVDSYLKDKVRCLCGSPLQTESMIKCEDPRCNEWQHIACVVIPEKPMEGVLPNPPEIFYCEICRLTQADPFWTTVAHPLYPVKLNITNVPIDGSNPTLSIEKTFQLTRADKDLLSKEEYDVQVWCILLNDKVTFRMQWPQYADLHVNGVPVRTINRPGSQMLGANGRDDGSIITQCTRDGINKISLTGCDARIFCVGVRIVKRRTVRQILSLIPKEAEGERFEDALARVRKCIGGGATTENADCDSDIEVVADFITVNLRCPMSGLRMKVAGRFKPCAHMGCFDLDVFVEMNQRSRKWQCPICLKNYSWEKIIIDPYFNRITSKVLSSGEDVAEIEVKPDGSWRVKAGCDRRGLGELELWHLPDGNLCNSSEVESKPTPEFKPGQQEIGCDTHSVLKLGIKKNQNGCWEFSKPGNSPNIIPMSSSGEDASGNQDGVEYASKSVNIDLTAAPAGDATVIVLSDSEDEAEPLVSSGPAVSGVHFPSPQNGVVDVFYENPTLGVTGGVGSRADLYNPNDVDEFGSSMWSLPTGGGQGASNFQIFDSDAIINANGGLVDNSTLAFVGNDPSLQIFLPTRPSDASAAAQPDSRASSGGLNGGRSEDWISLKLGDGGSRNQGASGAVNASLPDDVATILVGMNGGTGTGKTSRGRSDSPSSLQHQEDRSVKPRLYLSVDSDSE